MKIKKKIVIATGGTGGHVFPAFSLYQHFEENNFIVNIITDKRGFNFFKKSSNLKIKIINSDTIFKKNPIQLIIALIKIIIGITSSFFFLLKLKPDIIFGMGGYSSFPVCMAAKIMNIPFVLYENNLIIGKANKYLLPLSHKILVSNSDLKGVNENLRDKIFEVGNLIRKEMLNYSHKQPKLIDNRIKILILGGSQAAKFFAEKIPEIIIFCKKKNILIDIYQQCLPNQNEYLEEIYRSNKINFKLFNFSHNILEYFDKINLVITRSGSSILAELINCNIPFISIPLPSSADNHQFKNAKYFEKKGYNFTIEEKEISIKLFPLIKSILEDKSLLSRIINKQKKHSDKLVFDKINNSIKELIYEKN
jgi:UDP-N-acetylglucosamine--N-acetylmuramyl-(pentapeptide) pyrophosphoryl-undecaprenol N-acetylglucosamine transferase